MYLSIMRPKPHLAYSVGAVTANLAIAEEALSSALTHALILEEPEAEEWNVMTKTIREAQNSISAARKLKPSWYENGKYE